MTTAVIFSCGPKENSTEVQYVYKTPDFINKDSTIAYKDRMESTPVIFGDKIYDIISVRTDEKNPAIEIYEARNSVLVSKLNLPIFFTSAMVYNNELYVYGTTNLDVFASPLKIYKSTNLVEFVEVGSLVPNANRRIFNSSMIHNGSKFIITVEEDEDRKSTLFPNLYQSEDLIHWEKLSELRFNKYIACPTIKFLNNQYYMFYLLHSKRFNVYYTSISKSNDLINWIQSGKVVVAPTSEVDGQNASDFDLYEYKGQVVMSYANGTQDNYREPWVNIIRATYNGTMSEFVERFFN